MPNNFLSCLGIPRCGAWELKKHLFPEETVRELNCFITNTVPTLGKNSKQYKNVYIKSFLKYRTPMCVAETATTSCFTQALRPHSALACLVSSSQYITFICLHIVKRCYLFIEIRTTLCYLDKEFSLDNGDIFMHMKFHRLHNTCLKSERKPSLISTKYTRTKERK